MNRASWHNSCTSRWSNTKLDNAKRQYENQKQNAAAPRISKRRPVANVLESCLFCGLPHDGLIPFETFNAEYKTRRMVAEMHDDVVQDRFPNRDVAAAEMKYHFECLTSYRNQYRSYLHSRKDDATIHYQQCKMAAHHELYLFMELELKIGVIEFSRQLFFCLFVFIQITPYKASEATVV